MMFVLLTVMSKCGPFHPLTRITGSLQNTVSFSCIYFAKNLEMSNIAFIAEPLIVLLHFRKLNILLISENIQLYGSKRNMY